MKQVLMPVVFFTAILLTQSCRNNNSFGRHVFSDDGNKKTTIRINDESGSIKIECKGDVRFTDDDKAIAFISDGGYVRYTRDGEKLVIEPRDGGMVYKVNSGSVMTELDENGKQFLASAVKIMINQGIDAQGRVQRSYAQGGSQRVLEDVKELQSDYIRRLYLEYLFSKNTMTKNELLIAAQQISTLIGSDYDKSQLLEKNAKVFYTDSETLQAYLVALKSINSDYDKSNVLKSILRQQLNTEQFVYVISMVENVNSDYDKSNAIKEGIQQRKLSAGEAKATLKVIKTIQSDYDKSGVLKEMIQRTENSGEILSDLIPAIESVQSDYDKANVYKDLLDQNFAGEDQWIAIINSISKISSEYEKANVLVKVAPKMSQTDNVRSAYGTAAKTLTSEHEYSNVMKAVDWK
ncbi:hypothetical protein [Pollutibacter soli]|uniref:hypothetical protein n=1 Tax=Pollutibacter soli TaxID=3034157 RepID=UPI003013BAC7